MKIKYLAHAAFLITTKSGTRIVTDPYATSADFKHDEINESADIVTTSHEHFDHCNVAAVKGDPQVVKEAAEVKGIKIRAVATAHDETGGSQRGKNTVFCMDIDGINVCHAGDLGHMLTEEQADAMGRVDVLMLPVGGFFTIDAATAGRVCDRLKPKAVIPMHYKTDKMEFPIKGVDEFIKGKNNVTMVGGSEIELTPDSLPADTQIMVLQPSL